MATRKIRGLIWDPETGEGKIDKRIGGVRIQRRIKASCRDEAEAMFWRAVAEGKSGVGGSPDSITFRAAATKYLNEASHSSLDRDALALRKLDPWIGSLSVEAVHQGSLQAYIDHQRQRGLKSGSIARELSVVRRILTLCARVWRTTEGKPWLPAPPLIELPDWGDKAKPYPLSWEEERCLLAELPPHLAEMALFALNTGARDGVVAGLRWEWEVKIPELGTSVFLVPASATKNGTEFLLVLNRVARSLIDGRRGSGMPTVFGYEGRPVARMYNTAWKRAWKAAGLPVGPEILSGPHNLRHTFARRLRAVGVALETRKALMHHIDGDVTVQYSPAEISELLAAVELLPEARSVTLLRRVG